MINTEKTTGIIFSKNKPKNINVNLVINGKPIIMKENCKLLGVTFDSHLTWNAHIEELENKTNKNLNIMRCISGTNWGSSKSILLTIYKALILSHIDYCCFVYNDCSPTLKRKVDTIQYKSLLLAVGAMKGTALKALLGECGEIPLKLRRKKLILKYLLKIYTNPSNAASLVLQDKKFFNLGLNCKSPYQLLLHTFLNDTGIELEIEDIEHKITPWFEINYQIDLELLNILPSINDIFLRNSVIDNKLLELTSKYSHLIFVDGSVTKDSKAGAAIFSPSLSLNTNYKLPDALPIYYVEAFAILKALEYASSINLHNICIISDCSRVLQDIKNVSQNISLHPKLINNICIILNSLNDILLSWFPGHCSNSNILFTDLAAKSASHSLINPIQIKFTCSEAIYVLEEWIKGLWKKDWKSKQTCSYQKTFQLRSSYSSFSNIRRLDSAISRLRLMQTNLNAGRFKLGLHQDGLCTTCGVAEDRVHFTMFCSDTKDLRDQLLKTMKKINW